MQNEIAERFAVASLIYIRRSCGGKQAEWVALIWMNDLSEAFKEVIFKGLLKML